ncbi:MAG: hypothetical protein J1G05_03965 [Clostridiales bacterium]|nr:hypothetical protein [Clostridiales bacterium]
MSRFRTSILIVGMLVIIVAAALLTVFALFATGVVVTERIELYYAVHDAEKVYDGTPLVADEYELIDGELREGHRAVIEITGSQTEVGESKSSLTIKICDKDGYDVTDGYKIGVARGRLKVTCRNISVTLNDAEVMYDGTKVSFDDYTVTEGELVTGHKIAGSQNVQLINVNDELPSDLRPVVFDAVGNDVTKNYNVTFTMGEIKVVPRPLSVKPADVIKVYDGVEVTPGELEIYEGSLAEGQYFKGVEINYGDTSYIDVCEAVTRITKIAIYQLIGTEEVDVTENYILDYISETGVVRIEKRILTITAKSQSWLYDGTDHTVTNGDYPLSCEGLAPGELLLSVNQTDTIRDAGEKQHYVTNIRLSDNASLSNYEVISIPGTLTVLKRDLTIVTPTVSKTYDGLPLEGASEENAPTAMNIAPNQILKYDTENMISITGYGFVRNEFLCTIVDESELETDLAANYNITYVYGTLTVLKRAARVVTLNCSKPYDGVTLYGHVEESDIGKYNFVEWHTVEAPMIDDSPNIINADRILNSFEVTVYDEGNDVTENYDISYQYGYLEITPLNIKVRTKSETRVYNGDILRRDDTDFVNMPAGFRAVLADSDYPVLENVGEIINEVTFRLERDGYAVDESNYSFEYQYGSLKITPYNFHLKLRDYEFVYNGEAFDINNAPYDPFDESNVFDGILVRECFDLKPSKNEIKNAGSYSYTAVLHENFNPINFNIIITGGAIEIERCIVNVMLASDSFEYTGEVWVPNRYRDIMEFFGVNGDVFHLVDNPEGYTLEDFFSIVTSGTIKNVGRYTYTIKFNNSVDENNHVLYINGGEINVDKCIISNINLPNTEEYYDGQSHIPTVQDVISQDWLRNNLRAEDYKIVCESGSAINASAKPYYYTVQLVNALEAENYDLFVEQGSVTVLKYPVSFALPNNSYVYDAQSHIPSITDVVSQNSLPPHLTLDRLAVSARGDMKNAGEYEYSVEFKNGTDYVNYELENNTGRVTVNRCTVEITLINERQTYKAEEFLISFAEVASVTCRDSATGSVVRSPLITNNANILKNYFEMYTWETIKDVKTYYYGIRFRYKDDTENFKLVVNGAEGGEAEFVVTQLDANIESTVKQTHEKTYDGKVFTLDTASAVKKGSITLSAAGGEIPFAHYISVTCESSDSLVDTYDISISKDNVRVYNVYGEDITRNINITNRYAISVEIIPRDITFTLDNYLCTEVSKPYEVTDGIKECLRVSNFTPLLEGFYIRFNDIIEYNPARGTLTVFADDLFTIEIYNNDGVDVTENFNVTNIDDLSASVIVIG